MPYMVANSYWGLATEATYGTAASVSTFTPIASPKVTPTLKWLDDSDFRGSPVMHYDQVPGVRHDMFSGKTFMYTDVYPNLIRAALGGTDSVSSSVHTIGVGNFPNQGSQAPSYTIINNSVDATYQITAARLVDMAISFAADAAVETTFSFTGNISSTVASVTANESTQHLIPSWNCSASIGGASVAVVESASLDIKRSTAPIHTLGQQGPYNNFQGPLEVTGKMAFVVESGETWYNNALTRYEQPVILKFTDPATGYYVQFQMSAVQLENPVIDQSKAFLSLTSDFTAVANTTDAITGYAPIKAIISNNVATAY
jgi:Phage tail tube protein